VYRFRSFQNIDPPAIAQIWGQQLPMRGLSQSPSTNLLEQSVFSKPFFDPAGLVLAFKEERPVGFVHAAFGPTADHSRLQTELGVICMLMLVPEEAGSSLGSDLLAQGEDYLQRRGSQAIYAGCIQPLEPFYQGYYGGSELPGILESDEARLKLFHSQGYAEIDRVKVMHLDLQGFRPLVNRQQLQLRRQHRVETIYDPPSSSWWEACTVGSLEHARLQLSQQGGVDPLAQITTWNMEPLASGWGLQACGLRDLEVSQPHRRQGMATLLLNETFRQVQVQGISLIEAQVMAGNEAALGLYLKLGFTEIDQGVVLKKQ
jgi:ribosomal protein S18 acetylase RimI-like enzyme